MDFSISGARDNGSSGNIVESADSSVDRTEARLAISCTRKCTAFLFYPGLGILSLHCKYCLLYLLCCRPSFLNAPSEYIAWLPCLSRYIPKQVLRPLKAVAPQTLSSHCMQTEKYQ